MLYDLIIIGAGPAGMSAAVYAARNKLNFLVISKDIGGQAAWSSDVENYIGYQFVTGAELTKKFEEHVETYGVRIVDDEAADVKKANDVFEIKTKNGKKFSAKTIIVASGKKPRMLNVPGEKEFKGRGVTYCAVCDAPLFAKKDVAVIGGGNSALDAALHLAKYAGKIYLINMTDALGGEKIRWEKVKESKNVAVLNNSRTVEILGGKFVSGIKIEQNKKVKSFDVQGVFIEIGLVPEADFIKIAKKNKLGEIVVDQAAKTNVPGIFAAGDVTNTPEKQIVIAAGEGAKAALGAIRYLSGL